MHPALNESPIWFWALLIIGGSTMLLGAVSAIRYFDVKALLAYATVSQLGILVFLLAFDSEYTFIAVAVGILAHALYKGPLFLVAGIIDHATGTRYATPQRVALDHPYPRRYRASGHPPMVGIPPLFGFSPKRPCWKPSSISQSMAADSLAGSYSRQRRSRRILRGL